jgi:TonB-linked outer membrane protein, SusC/RagA family
MMNKLTHLFLCLFIGIGLASAQTKTVRGTIISADDNEPVIGASVLIKGTTTGTVTDFDGVFSLSVPTSATTLVISYLGMVTQEVAVAENINVVLQSDMQRLNEVVVTAMGISREKKALGYAVQDVKGDQLTQAASSSLSSALQGKVSGVDIMPSSGMPGASSKITIRGSRSFTGDNTPLYVVDGMPIASTADVGTGNSVTGSDYANRAVDLDPNDIESINILKGQAASALYGMRASNGVVVITTKSGRGAKSGKPEVTFNTNLSFDQISVKPDIQTEYAQGSNFAYNPTSSMSWGPKIADLVNDPRYGGNTDNAYTREYGMQNGRYYVPQRANAGLDPWATPQVYNNVDDFFQTGASWSNSVNVAQGFDNGNYSFSLGNLTSNGIVPSTGMDRYNVKLGGEAKLNSNFTTGFVGNFTTSKITKQSGANNGIVATIYGAPSSYDLKGIPSHIEGDPYTQNTFRGTSGFDGAYWAIENNRFSERSQRFFGNAFLNYLSKLGTDNQSLNLKYQIGHDAYTTNYSDVWGYGHSNGRGEVEEYHYTINEFNALFTALYNWTINEDLVFDALIGNEFVDGKRKYGYAYGMNFNFSGWNHMDNASVYQASERYTKSRTVGTFGNASLAYRNMLYLNATVRTDVVSTMPRGNRTFTYPSVSLGWIFTELEPLRSDFLTYGKLRASYAEVGMAGVYYNSYYTTPTYGGGFSSGTPIIYPLGGAMAFTPYGRAYDPNLKPQNTKSYEVGADFSFLNGLFSLNYTYSRQNVKDQIFAVPLAGSTGVSELVTNGGSMHTNVHELTLGVNPINTRNIKWDFGFNFSKIDNYVDELAPGVESIFLGGFVEPQVRAGIGYKYPVIYGVSYLRNDVGQIVVDSKGIPLAGEEKVIGTVAPDFRLGFNTNLDIHKFRVSAVVDWKQGGQMYAATPGLMNLYGISQHSADIRNQGTYIVPNSVKITGTDAQGNNIYAPNDIVLKDAAIMTDEDRANGVKTIQDYYLEDNNVSESMIKGSSFVKLREISVSYPVYEKSWLNVRLNVFARNILLWSELDGIDPETAQGNNNMGGAFERFSLPNTFSYGLGLNVKF